MNEKYVPVILLIISLVVAGIGTYLVWFRGAQVVAHNELNCVDNNQSYAIFCGNWSEKDFKEFLDYNGKNISFNHCGIFAQLETNYTVHDVTYDDIMLATGYGMGDYGYIDEKSYFSVMCYNKDIKKCGYCFVPTVANSSELDYDHTKFISMNLFKVSGRCMDMRYLTRHLDSIVCDSWWS